MSTAGTSGTSKDDGNFGQNGILRPGKTKGTVEDMGLSRPGKVTHGPGKNKVKMHLVASGNKIPAEIIAHALAKVQAGNSSGTGPQKLPNHTPLQGANPEIHKAQHSQPPGVASTTPGQTRNTSQPKRDVELKTAGVMAARASQPSGVKALPMVQFDKRSSLQKRKDRSARMA